MYCPACQKKTDQINSMEYELESLKGKLSRAGRIFNKLQREHTKLLDINLELEQDLYEGVSGCGKAQCN